MTATANFRQMAQHIGLAICGLMMRTAFGVFGILWGIIREIVNGGPHAGLAYGLDRLIMLMAGEDSIREVMAFPKVKDASCLMMQAPDEVDPKQLEELGLGIEKKEEKEEK